MTDTIEETAEQSRDRLTKEFAGKIETAEAELDAARLAEQSAKRTMQDARAKFSDALTAWQNGFAKRTIRQELDAIRENDIADKLAGRVPKQIQPGPSILDHTLAAGRGGSQLDQSGLGRRPRRGQGKSLKGFVIPQPIPPRPR